MNNTIQYTVDQDGIAILTFDLPGKSMNVLTPELMEDLDTLVRKAAEDDAVKGIVLTSAKKAFIAGADIKDMVTAYDRGVTHKEATEFSAELNRTLRAMETCGKPVAAAINGLALGGGLEVCLAWPMTRAPCWAFPKSTSACCPAPAARNGRRDWSASATRPR